MAQTQMRTRSMSESVQQSTEDRGEGKKKVQIKESDQVNEKSAQVNEKSHQRIIMPKFASKTVIIGE